MSLISSNKVETNRVQLEFSVDAETFNKALDRAYKKMVKKLTVPGFRKGKAPKSVVEKMYGVEVFYDDAINFVYPEAYMAAVAEAKIEPVAAADVEIKEISKENGCTIVAVVAVKPEVTMGKYKGLQVTQVSAEVTEEDVAAELKKMQENNARTLTVEDRAAQNGDTATVNFEGFVDGVAFEGGKAEEAVVVLGAGNYIPGFEDGIVGKKVGEEFDIEVTFPENYGEASLAGKAAVFKSKLLGLKYQELPELDDEFAKDVDDEVETLDALKEKLKKALAERKEQESKSETEQNVYRALVEVMTAEIPFEMVENAVDDIMRDYEQRMRMQGMTFDRFMKYTGMDMEGLRASVRPSAEYKVQVELALDTVAQLEKLDPTAEEIAAEYEKLAPLYQVELDMLKAMVPEADIKEVLSRRKAYEFVSANAKFVAEETEEAEKPAKAAKTTKTTKTTKAKAEKAEKSDEEKPAKKPATRKRTTKKSAEEAPAETEEK